MEGVVVRVCMQQEILACFNFLRCTIILLVSYTVEPPNNGQVGNERFVHFTEVVPSSEFPPP